MKHIIKKLEAEMSKAVTQIVAASHVAAHAALNEAFGLKQPQGKDKAEPAKPRQTRRKISSARRNRLELEGLQERLLREVCATPGATMKMLASRVGASPKELQFPVRQMKAARKLKTVGARQFMRYFPLDHLDEGEPKAARTH